jgi:hypothetical protein
MGEVLNLAQYGVELIDQKTRTFHEGGLFYLAKRMNVDYEVKFDSSAGCHNVKAKGQPIPDVDSRFFIHAESNASRLGDAMGRCLAAIIVMTKALHMAQKMGVGNLET